jgi:3-phenylpropionate/trans-cinnamate dioxygenase ferredoxin subunit
MMAPPPDNNRFVAAFPVAQVARGTNRACMVGGTSVLIAHAHDGFYAVANSCTHAAQPLEGGRIQGHALYCPVHGARFDLRTGKGSGLAMANLATFQVRVMDDTVFVKV